VYVATPFWDELHSKFAGSHSPGLQQGFPPPCPGAQYVVHGPFAEFGLLPPHWFPPQPARSAQAGMQPPFVPVEWKHPPPVGGLP
jgi:hypothetical protein